MRQKTPHKREAELLFLNRHSCCICHEKNKDVQVHHIDGDKSNNNLGNLAVLCLDCHSKVTGRRGLGRSYSALEVQKYKRQWESIVKTQYDFLSAARLKPISRIGKELFLFEIKRLIYEMLGASDSQESIIDRNMAALLYIFILEGLQEEIMYHLQLAFTISAVAGDTKPIALARALPEFFGYLVGPSVVEMRKKDMSALTDAIEVIKLTHNTCLDQNKNYRLLRVLKDGLVEFIRISILYKRNKIFRKAIQVLEEIRESTQTIYYVGDKKMPRLTGEIDDLFLDIQEELKKAKLRWKLDLFRNQPVNRDT